MVIWIDHNGYLQTDLYQKPGKKCQYLIPTSAHPTPTTQGIPYSLAYRLRRICSMVTVSHSEGESSVTQDLHDWEEHLRYRRKHITTVPRQLSSRLEDLMKNLKS